MARERQRRAQKRTKGKNRQRSQWEKSLRVLEKFGKRSQWEEENILGLEEFGAMMEEKWRERRQWWYVWGGTEELCGTGDVEQLCSNTPLFYT